MRKRAIFEDVVSIMTHDSSTIKDRKGCDPEPFREKMADDMTDDAFLYQVRSYLASFGIIGHFINSLFTRGVASIREQTE